MIVDTHCHLTDKKLSRDIVGVLERARAVGVGEIGLDFHYDKEKKTKNKQIELFEKLKERNLPKGVFHCWGGDGDFLEYVLDKGFYVSFCGNATYKSNGLLRDLLKLVPLDRLLLETDSPYLSPEPLRGELNEPKNVKITAKFIASILGVGLNTLINQTTKNSLCLFSLEN